MADAMIRAGYARRILVLAAEVLSRIADPSDFATCPYFGDGAGAVLLEGTEKPVHPWLAGGVLYSDGKGADFIRQPAGGSRLPPGKVTEPRQNYLQMNGRAVFEFATVKGAEVIEELCQTYSVPKEMVRHCVLHQANINIISAIAQKTGIPMAKFAVNVERYGNTGGASPFIAFDELVQGHPATRLEGHCLMVSFGAGLSWGGMVIAPPISNDAI
jgi:3-oxoacyl-[acyl-carrier-protein] synthase-3